MRTVSVGLWGEHEQGGQAQAEQHGQDQAEEHGQHKEQVERAVWW